LNDAYILLRALHSVKLLDGEVADTIVQYLVKRGYDSDDLLKLSSKRGGHRRGLLVIEIVSKSAPELKNKSFMNHCLAFM
jgi:hypothetical protein